MLGTYSYNEIIRKTIIAFGTLFNEVYIKHEKHDGTDYSFIKVPIAYGPAQKFLARVEQKPDLKKRVAMSLPRMSFEMTSLKYDSSRKVSAMQTFKAMKTNDKTEQIKVFMPVPYNIGFQLSTMTKLDDEMLQIVEQILPVFQPSFNLTINLISSIGEKKDIPVILEGGVNIEDNYESNYTERRALVYTLNFTAKTYLFGPVLSASSDIIKKVSVGFIAASSSGADSKAGSRDLTYSAEPRAIKNYTGTITTSLVNDIGLSETEITVADASSIPENTYID